MLSAGGNELEQEIAALETKQREIGAEYDALARIKAEATARLSNGVC